MAGMNDRLFEETPVGVAALLRFGNVSENFRIYEVERLGQPPEYSDVFKVTGAEFRVAEAGPYKGLLSVLVPRTRKIAYIDMADIRNP